MKMPLSSLVFSVFRLLVLALDKMKADNSSSGIGSRQKSTPGIVPISPESVFSNDESLRIARIGELNVNAPCFLLLLSLLNHYLEIDAAADKYRPHKNLVSNVKCNINSELLLLLATSHDSLGAHVVPSLIFDLNNHVFISTDHGHSHLFSLTFTLFSKLSIQSEPTADALQNPTRTL